MNGQPKVTEDTAKSEDRDFDDTAEMSLEAVANTDNVGDASVEINLDELISEVEAAGLPTDHFEGHEARKNLEVVLEEKRLLREVADFEDFDFD